MSNWRHYEILLPRKFNDGTLVPNAVISSALLHLEQRFGAVSWETQLIQGAWHDGGKRYRDELFRVFIDVDDTPTNREFFRQFKERLKSDFQEGDMDYHAPDRNTLTCDPAFRAQPSAVERQGTKAAFRYG